MSVDSKMTAIADKIRGLRGLTGTMGLDAMATNLQAEQTSITNALAALADKGVTVPDGSTSDALAGLIEALEIGGGSAVETGTITPSSDDGSQLTITHDLGVVPNFAAIVLTSPFETAEVRQVISAFVLAIDVDDSKAVFGENRWVDASGTKVSQSHIGNYSKGYAFTDNSSSTGISFSYARNNSIQYKPRQSYSSSTTTYLLAGKTYRWVVAYLDIAAIQALIRDSGGFQ